jgi:predicted ester cyclase
METNELRDRIVHLWTGEVDLQGLLTPDCLFEITSTGNEYRGPREVERMLNYFFREAFTARMQVCSVLSAPDALAVEAHFTGQHTGDFGGIAATGQDFCVPMAVFYDLVGERVSAARIYLHIARLLEQLGVEE